MPSPRHTAAAAYQAVVIALTVTGHLLAPADHPGDLLVTREDRRDRVRVRAGQVGTGALQFNARTRGPAAAPDLWAVWSPQLEATFLIPAHVVATTTCRLRIDPPSNRQDTGVHYAADYLLSGAPALARRPEVDQTLPAGVVAAADAYRAGTASRDEVDSLQRHLSDIASRRNLPAAAAAAGLSLDQARALTRNHQQGRVTKHDASRGRKTNRELCTLARPLADHPAAAAHLPLLSCDPGRFLFKVAIDATDGSPPAVRRFLVDAGWDNLQRSTVHNRMKTFRAETHADLATAAS